MQEETERRTQEIHQKYFTGSTLVAIFDEFVQYYFSEKSESNWNIGNYKGFVEKYQNADICDFSWNRLCIDYKKLNERVAPILIQLYKFIISKGYYKGEYRDYIENNKWILDFKKGMNPNRTLYVGAKPYYFYEIKLTDGTSEVKTTRFNLNTDKAFTKDLLISFIATLSDREKAMTRFKEFVFWFQKSLYSLDNEVNSVEDFNYNTFSKQYRFYRRITWGGHKATTILNRFYIFLIDYLEKVNSRNKVFYSNDRVDKFYLYKESFDTLYSKGYRVTYFNRFDSIPEWDRWLVAPNGEEKNTTARKTFEYCPIDFLKVVDVTLRKILKRWYWESEGSIYGKDKGYYVIVDFANFLFKLKHEESENNIIYIRNLNENITINNITVDNIIEYRLYLVQKYDSIVTRNRNIDGVKNFIRFIYDNELMQVEFSVFDYLKGYDDKDMFGGNPILDEDLKIIVSKYKALAEEDTTLNKLYWIIFNLCTTTNLRISEVLNLQRDCLVETMKLGQFAIKYFITDEESNDNRPILRLTRKGSDGAYKEENINRYTERMIRDAISLTSQLSEFADKEIKKYLFLIKGSNSKVITISKDRFYRHFKKTISSFKLKGGPYTVYNLRHTFMSNIFNQGKKDGRSVFDIHTATGHQDLRTTIIHYRESGIKNYLEATYHVCIDDVDIKGVITKNIQGAIHNVPDNLDSITVGEKCGFCKRKGCNDFRGIDCLICKHFVVTLDRIPFLKSRISILEEKVSKEKIDHEKEHLIVIKKLLVRYLERLYELKAGT